MGLNPSVTISRDFFGYFLSRKESNVTLLVSTCVKPIPFFPKWVTTEQPLLPPVELQTEELDSDTAHENRDSP